MDTHKHIITCTLWNASVRNKHLELSKFLNEHNIDIAIITKTWLKPSDNFKLRNYNTYRKDRPTIQIKTQEEGYSSLSAMIFPSNTLPNPNLRTSNFCLSN